ncbi:MAG: C39 family peptidase [Candidatus Pacebacteria bacterium]|nr:C39 family peptidase [Candidatus Paceibacterota bacterium]
MKKFITLFLSSYIFFYSTHIIKANQLIFNDNFDDQSFDDWSVVQNEGDNKWGVCLDNAAPTNWRIEDGWMGLTIDGSSCTLVIKPNNLDLSNQSGFQFEFDWRFDESVDMDRNIVLLWQDKNNWYDIKTYGSGVNLEKVINGIEYPLVNSHTTFPFIADETYHFSISYLPNRDIKVLINNQVIISTTDQEPFLNSNTDGIEKTIALKTSKGGAKRSVSFFDNLVVTSLGEVNGTDSSSTILDVPIFKQSDPLWAEHEYDSALTWSEKPTIKRWGCALSSMSMILNYYKIDKLPNGQSITPDSLNNWLNSQPDGYIGEGLLNWMAITRLTKQISNILGTPKLEYSRISSNLLETTIEQIQKSQPTILNIFGHFLVSNGFTNDLLDLNIIDPIYNYKLFSEHQTQLLSTRVFTPSFTDLSYIMIVSDIYTDVEILDSNNQTLIDIEQFEESLGSDTEEKEIKQYKITQLSKPASGEYTVNFLTTNNSENNISIYSYDEQGTVTKLEDNLQINGNQSFLLNYHKEVSTDNNQTTSNITTINKIVTWSSLLQTVEIIKNKHLIKDIYSNYLIKVINWAEVETIDNQKRYLTLLNNYLNKIDISEEIRSSLLSNLNYLKDSI